MWNTVEVGAWSRNFSYDDYINLHKLSGYAGTALCEEAYKILCKALEIQYEYDNKIGEN